MVGDTWFFDRLAPFYDVFMPAADPAVLANAVDHADGDVERVFDVGGGTGRAVRTLDSPERVVLDASAEMLGRVPSGIGRIRGDARSLPVASASVDAILIVDALHHLPDPERVIDETRRVLRPGGILVIREFDPSTVRGRILEGAEHLLGMDSRFYSSDDLLEICAEAGFVAAVLDRGFAVTVVGRKPGK